MNPLRATVKYLLNIELLTQMFEPNLIRSKRFSFQLLLISFFFKKGQM